jgi:hypothetical protein
MWLFVLAGEKLLDYTRGARCRSMPSANARFRCRCTAAPACLRNRPVERRFAVSDEVFAGVVERA